MIVANEDFIHVQQDAMEQAAKVCDAIARHFEHAEDRDGEWRGALLCAEAIREIIEELTK